MVIKSPDLSGEIGPDSLPLGVVDRFLVFGVREAARLCPTAETLKCVADGVQRVESLDRVTAVFDIRGLPDLYHDVAEMIRELGAISLDRCLLVEPERVEEVKTLWHLSRHAVNVLSTRGQPVPLAPVDLRLLVPADYFDDGEGCGLLSEVAHQLIACPDASDPAFASALPDIIASMLTAESSLARDPEAIRRLAPYVGQSFQQITEGMGIGRYRTIAAAENGLRAAVIRAILLDRHEQSLLTQYALVAGRGVSEVQPFHGHALHGIDVGNNEPAPLIGRPSVFASRTRCLFSHQFLDLERLLQDPHTSEHEYQRFFERHPNFLRALGYAHIHPQVVLERDDGTSLRPDFILEPVRGEWCDILDIKRPTETLVVGARDRKSFGSAVHQVAAQLREYSAALDEERIRRQLRDKYGLRVYRPRLIALIGRDTPPLCDEQVRRAMTAYDQFSILTFDNLLRHARQHLLV